MVSEGVGEPGEVSGVRVVHLSSVMGEILVLFDGVVGRAREEESIQDTPPPFVLVLLRPVLRVVGLVELSLGKTHLLLRHHGRIDIEIGPAELHIPVASDCGEGEGHATDKGREEEPFAEHNACIPRRINMCEIMAQSLQRNLWHTCLRSLLSTRNPHCERPGEHTANEGMDYERNSELLVECFIVVPGPSLRTRHIVLVPRRQPLVFENIILQPLDVFDLFLARRHRRRADLQNGVRLPHRSVLRLVLFRVKRRLAPYRIVRRIPVGLRRHINLYIIIASVSSPS